VTGGPESVPLSADGAAIHGVWWRPKQDGRPTLVFLHDGLGSVESLRGFPSDVAEAAALPAFGYDRWGYGRSAARPRLPAGLMEDCAARLPRILAAAGIADHIVIGHSDGGTIALLHAAANPSGLLGAVSIAAHVQEDSASHFQLDRHGAMARAGECPDWLVRFQGEKMRAVALMSEWVRVWQESFAAGWTLRDVLQRIRCPLLALHGAEDDYGEVGQLKTIARAVPRAETRILDGLGHFPHLDDPAGVTARVAAFVTRCVEQRG
jgi:pimeloyl-ACP methyl ester carboxylesterase